MRGNSSVILRRLLVRRQVSNLNSTNIAKSLISPSANSITVTKIPSLRNYIAASSSQSQSQMLPSLQFHRTLFSSPDGPSNILVIESGEEFNSSLGKVKDDSLPAIFYFTAAWCGPCKFIWPVIGELSAKHPHVTTYKIDIDQKFVNVGTNIWKVEVVKEKSFASYPRLDLIKRYYNSVFSPWTLARATMGADDIFIMCLLAWQKPKPRAAISKGLESTLSKLNISAVPTFLFFQNGEKVAEIVGADVSRLKTTMEQLYKKD